MPAGWWVVLLTLPALAPLARAGFFSSDDGLLHIYRLAALDRAVRAGVLYPRWFPEFAFGYGHPVLNFYGPLSYYWGLPFMLLGADASLATQLVLATGLVASALSMYLFARLHLERGPAVIAAVVYAYLPYHLVDLYLRGAVAEFLAFVWFPLVLWALHRLVEDPEQRGFYWPGLASLLIAALVVTHSLSAFIFAPVLVGYAVILLGTHGSHARGRRRAAGRVLLALAIALAVSAFYWLPVLTEARYVGLGHGASQGYRDHLLSLPDLFSLSPTYPYPAEPDATYPLGLIQVVIIACALVLSFLLVVRTRHRPSQWDQGRRSRQQRWVVLLFLAVALFSVFMLAAASLPVWQALEWGLAFLQYPWRFQALTVLATAFLAGALVQSGAMVPALTHPTSRRKAAAGSWKPIGVVLLLVTGIWSLWRLPITPSDSDLAVRVGVEAMWQMDRDHGQVGATWTGEYLPIWVTEQRWAISHPAPEPARGRVFLPAGQVKLNRVAYTRYDLTLDAPQGASLALHQFHYPGWRALLRQGNAGGSDLSYDSHPAGALGLVAFDLPPASGPVSLRLGLTVAQRWGTLVSLMACLAVGVALVAQYQLSRTRSSLGPRSALGPLLLAACYLLLAAVLLASLALPSGYLRATNQVNANLEDSVELLAYTDVLSAYTDVLSAYTDVLSAYTDVLSAYTDVPSASATGKTGYRPGDSVDVTLYWRALSDLDQDYKTFVHLTDAALTRQPAQHDGDPGGGFTPTTRWLPGELVPDTHHLALPADLAPGRYLLWAGMYEYATLRNLAILSAEAPVANADGRVLLGEIEVVSP